MKIANKISQLIAFHIYNNRLKITPQYDGDGSLTKETYSRLNKTSKDVTYAWNTENRLSGITYHTANVPAFMPTTTDNKMNFVYDDYGNRTMKQSNTEISYYLNDGLTVLNELDAAGAITKSIIAGLDQVAEIDASGTIKYVHQDVLGSTVLVTNQSGGVEQDYEYEPFGQLVGGTMNSDDKQNTKYLYTGQEFDSESELYYYNARYYNPRMGRFISRDPVLGKDGDLLSRNSYIYVKNNPLRYVDPSGKQTKEAQAAQKAQWDKLEKKSLWDKFVISIGNKAEQVAKDCSICAGAMDHPIIIGAVAGLASGAAIVGGVYVVGGEIVCGLFCEPVVLAGGNTAVSTGRTTAENLNEQLAMKEVITNPNIGQVAMNELGDPRLSGWSKMRYVKVLGDGTKIVIHYVAQFTDGVIKSVADFKFK